MKKLFLSLSLVLSFTSKGQTCNALTTSFAVEQNIGQTDQCLNVAWNEQTSVSIFINGKPYSENCSNPQVFGRVVSGACLPCNTLTQCMGGFLTGQSVTITVRHWCSSTWPFMVSSTPFTDYSFTYTFKNDFQCEPLKGKGKKK